MKWLRAERTDSAACPSCGSTQVVERAELPATAVLSCERCDLCFGSAALESGSKDPIETEEAFYEGIMNSFGQQQEVARERVKRRLAAYREWLGRPVESLLEIGCATGAYASAFAELGIRYCGVEIDPRLAQFAKSHGDFELFNSNFFDLGDIGTFDVIFASQVLEHVQDPTSFINHAKQFAPSGLIHLDVPNQESLVASARKVLSRTEFGFIQPPHHMIAYNKKALSDLFTRCEVKPLIADAFRNDDPVWGQLVTSPSAAHRLSYALSGAIGKGSLLVGVGAVLPRAA